MAYRQLQFGYTTGKTLTFSIYNTVSGEVDIDQPLVEVYAGSGYYKADVIDTAKIGDLIIIKESGNVVAQGWLNQMVNPVNNDFTPSTVTASRTIIQGGPL